MMIVYRLRFATLAAIAVLLSACSDTAEDAYQVRDEATATERHSDQEYDIEGDVAAVVDEVLGEFSTMLREFAEEGRKVEPAHLEDLEALLPKRVDGLRRVLLDHRQGLIGLGVADVHATYSDEEREISIDIVDLGSLSPLVRKVTHWLEEEVDRDTHQGFERTRTFRQRGSTFPAFESYTRTKATAECAMIIWVSDRFFVFIDSSGSDVTIEDCNDARDEVSFRRLERLARRLQGK